MIPRIVHRIWLGGQSPTDPFGEKWKSLHPAWNHQLWTARNLPALRNQRLFNEASCFAMKSDVLRYELMARFGGVYVDFDMEPVKPLDHLLNRRAFLGRIQPTFQQIVVQEIEIAVIGSEPGNPFWKHVIRALPAWAEQYKHVGSVATRTGPQFVQRLLNSWNGPLPLDLLPANYFYPFRWCEPKQIRPESYAIHHWWGSWVANAQHASAPVDAPSRSKRIQRTIRRPLLSESS